MGQRKIKQQRRQEKLASKIFERKENKIEIKGVRQILKENWKFLLVLLMGVVIVYFNSLWGDFVSDDYATILHNPEIRTKWAGGVAATDHPFAIPPITNHLIALIFGVDSPIPFHCVNLILYLICIVVAFVFLKLLFSSQVSMVATTLFAFHPIHVESVSWISGKPYLYTGIFQLLFYISLIYVVYGRKKYYWLMFTSLLLSFFTARVHSLAFIFVTPLILLFLAYERSNLISKDLFWKVFGIVIGVTPILFLILWPAIKGRVGDVNFGYRGDGGIFYDPFFQYPTSIAKYLQVLWFPVDLTLYHTMYTFPVWLNWLIFIIYLSLLVYTYLKDKKLFFCLAFIFLTTAPAMAPVKVSWLMAERYMFLGSLGWVGFLTLIINQIFAKNKTGVWVVAIFLSFLFSIKIYLRNIDWQTNHNLWVATVQVSPNSHNAWNNIGDDYDKLGQYENAIKGFTQSTVMKQNYADAYHNRANIYFKTGYFDLARDSYMTALSFNPGLVQTYISLVQIELTVGRLDAALELANKVVEIDPNNFQVRYVRAVVLKELNMLSEAKKEAEMSLRLNPNFQQAKELYNAI